MYRPYFRLGIIAFVFLLLLIFIVSRILGGGDRPAPTPPSVPIVKPLPEYADSFAAVSITIDGQVNGDEAHRGIRVTIDRFQRKLEILGGYNQNILAEHKIENNQTAYDIFLRSLRNSGFTVQREGTDANADERGVCPLGTRTIFELRDSGETLLKRWTTSCGTRTGNFGGNTATVRSLFQKQITDYNKLTAEVDL